MAVIPPGGIIQHSLPYAHVLAQSQRGIRCEECFQSPSKLLRCSSCTVARYCNRSCQKAAWKFHKEECPCYKRVAPNIPSASARLMFRLILRWKWGDHKRKDLNLDKVNIRSFEEFMSHTEEIKMDETRKHQFMEMCQTLRLFIGNQFDLPQVDVLLQIFGKMTVNSFSVCDSEMQPIGVAVYLGCSVFDHSCQPNAVATFRGAQMQIRVLQGLNGSELDKVYLSYIEQLACTEERQTQLTQQYYFTCRCPLCADRHRDAEIQSSICSSVDCKGMVLQQDGRPLTCDQCGCTIVGEYAKAHCQKKCEVIHTSLQVLEKLKDCKTTMAPGLVLEECEACLEKQRGVLHDMNVCRVRVLDKAMDACIDLGKWQEALLYGLLTLPAYRRFYPEFHPSLGVQLLRVGKIQLYLQQLKETLKTLHEAESILRVTHGRDHPLYRDELSSLLDQCSEEFRSRNFLENDLNIN